MANTNAPFGFSQYSGTGSAPTYEQVQLAISATSSTNPQIFYGDAVAQLSTGFICQMGTNSTGDGGTAGAGDFVGVFVGCKYLSVSQKRTVWSNYFPGVGDVNSTAPAVTAYVITDPNAQFVVQTANSNTTASAATLAAIGQNIAPAYGLAPSGAQGSNTNTLGNNNGNIASGLSTAYADLYTLGTSNAASIWPPSTAAWPSTEKILLCMRRPRRSRWVINCRLRDQRARPGNALKTRTSMFGCASRRARKSSAKSSS